jgi:hypothetical protein
MTIKCQVFAIPMEEIEEKVGRNWEKIKVKNRE